MPRILVLALLAVGALSATAAAQESPPAVTYLSPQPEARLALGRALNLRVSAPGAVVIRVSTAPDTDDYGRLTGPLVGFAESPEWQAPQDSLVSWRPGTYYWQAELVGPEAEQADDPVGGVEHFDVVLPRSARRRGTLYPRFGRRGRTRFYLSEAGIPDDVPPARFAALARTSARRWGLKGLRFTSAVPARRDGYNIVGFSARVPANKLGVQTDYVAKVYRRTTRCRGAVCRTSAPVYAGRRLLEQDIALRRQAPWHAGPGSPPLDRVDLETVLVHELGHMAGNHGHRPACANSPLTAGLGPGEWWHGPRDRFVRRPCSARASLARSEVVVDRVVVTTPR